MGWGGHRPRHGEMYGSLVGDAPPVRPETLRMCLAPASEGDDPLTGRPLRFGPTGYELAGTPSQLGPPADAFGHTGAGGSSHGGWPSLRTGYSYVTGRAAARGRGWALRRPSGGASSSGHGPMSRPPNIVLVMADQLAASALPVYGNSTVRAPGLSALAARGTVFESAYCPSPLCAPSRAAMLTGRRPSAIGVHDNACELPASTPTIAHLLRAAGYRTALAGKMHFVGSRSAARL